MPTLDLSQLLNGVARLRVAVIGDVMLDRFVFGVVDRISPEAPVPVVHVRDEQERLGGAANVAANVAALGSSVTLFGVTGVGAHSDAFLRSCAARGLDTAGLVADASRVTSIKTRILVGSQQVVRIDRETKAPLDAHAFAALTTRLRELGAFDLYIVSDYGKGVVDERLMEEMRRRKRDGVPVVVDPKQGDFQLYRDTTCITPNAKEAGGACHDAVDSDADAERVARLLQERLRTDLLLVTRGDRGMSLRDCAGRMHHLATAAREVFDVTGAGDTVIAVFAATLAAGAAPELAAALSNSAAGLVVREIGTAVVHPAQLARAYAERNS
jgi:D-beta-D-heptose 7-phosphate kinase/D-beta-D-heptose 1-phosphate adenosyltransferase